MLKQNIFVTFQSHPFALDNVYKTQTRIKVEERVYQYLLKTDGTTTVFQVSFILRQHLKSSDSLKACNYVQKPG